MKIESLYLILLELQLLLIALNKKIKKLEKILMMKIYKLLLKVKGFNSVNWKFQTKKLVKFQIKSINFHKIVEYSSMIINEALMNSLIINK